MNPTDSLFVAIALGAVGAIGAAQDLDCGYRSPAWWQAELHAGVARGEIPDPARRSLPVLPPSPTEDTLGLGGPTPCLSASHLFLYPDSNQLLLTNFSTAELIDFMTQAANALLATHGDQYDFLGYWLTFEPNHLIGAAFYKPISNDVTGIGDPSTIGMPIFDFHAAMGLAGTRLQGWVMMWNVNASYWQSGSGSGADFTRLALGQEFEHRYAMFLPPLLDGRVLQGDDASCGRTFHWNWKVDGQGSAMEISEWVGSSPASLAGSFVTFNTDTGGLFSYTDLYLMGYVSPAEMDVGNSQLRYMNQSSCGSTYAGPISAFSSADLVASAGARVPDSTSAQKDFRTGWIVIHLPGSPPTSSQLAKIVGILQQHQIDWYASTLQRGTMNDTLFADCNCNGIPDATDIANGILLDADHDMAADTCEPPVGTGYCFGDLTGAPCPCGNHGAGSHGCASSAQSAGGQLLAYGTTNPDSLAMHAASLRSSTFTVFFQGTAVVTPFNFGDGLRCTGGTLVRFGGQNAVNGVAGYPGNFSGSVSSAGGVTPGSGQTRHYQAFYRDAAPGFCTSATFNTTSGVSIVW